MKLHRALFDKPLPGTIAGRRMQSSLCIDDANVASLTCEDGFVQVTTAAGVGHWIPVHRVASLQPAQESVAKTPAKRRGRPPGSKNRKPADDDQPTSTGESVPSD